MGIDIYLRWEGQTEEEQEAQITGFDITMGRVGYLRETYHSEPYATRILIPEAFDDACIVDPEGDDENGALLIRSPQDRSNEDPRPFVLLADFEARLPAALEATAQRYDGDAYAARAAQSFRDFVTLAKTKVEEGKRVLIYASW